ncbi:monocarboxylate transporter [Penicillium malachiteum]|uniref:monocarboxylate transporter n=1 Tax=Penicillium malachiteum TaxID=1324776 RepID=UPI0025489044|nr:monocarboxylate transporter [Penicillium malachiteum]KAJ5729095.1 monocarboxylate transporter [Penicillium malachiteum]
MSVADSKSALPLPSSEHECKSIEKETPKAEWTQDAAPDGGLTAWLVALGAWCSLFCTFGWINSVGVFQSYYETELLSQYSSSTIAWIPSLQIFFMFAMGPIVGQLYDKFGPRYLILGGSFLHVFGLMMASISKEYYQVLLSQGVCSAMGTCAIFQPSMTSIPSWFNKKRGAAYGIVATGSSLGGVIFPIMVSKLMDKVGYGWTMRTAAFMILALLVVANLTVRSRVPPKPRTMSKETLLKPFREIKMLLVIGGFLCLTFGIFVPINYLVVEAMEAGMSTYLANYLVAMLNAASLFGRILAGISSDKLGHYNILVVACLLAGILVLALWVPATSNAAIIVFACTFGFASGAYVSLANALVVKISPFPEIGYRTGLLFLFSSIGGLTANPIAGAILQHENGSYTGMKIFAGIFLLAGSLWVMAARFVHTGFDLKAKF